MRRWELQFNFYHTAAKKEEPSELGSPQTVGAEPADADSESDESEDDVLAMQREVARLQKQSKMFRDKLLSGDSRAYG